MVVAGIVKVEVTPVGLLSGMLLGTSVDALATWTAGVDVLNGGAPHWLKCDFNRLKSRAVTALSPVKSARPSYPGWPADLPNVNLTITKSCALTQLLSSASPSSREPMSMWL